MTKQQHQADTRIHEDQLLHFLVNVLTGAFGITENGDIEPEEIYKLLVGTTAGRIWISTL